MTEQFKQFKIGELFTVTSGKWLSKVDQKPGKTPFISSSAKNNGIMTYINKKPLFPANTITVASHGSVGATFFQTVPYYASSNVNSLSYKNGNLSEKVGLYFVAAIQHVSKNYGFSHILSVTRTKQMEIMLPVTPMDEPDFEYMAMQIREFEVQRVRELETERIRELEAYLRVTGLDDITLSASEAQVLTQDVKWKKFRIGDVFEKPGKGDVDLQNDDVDGIGEYFINSGETNLGIKGRTSREAKVFPKNTITIDFFGNVYYRDFSYKLATHNHVFSFQSDLIKSREIGLYLVGALGYLKKKFSYHNMLTWNKLKKLDIQLPITATGDIDFDYMQNYIRATEKQTIKDVVEYKDRVIKETKKVVNE